MSEESNSMSVPAFYRKLGGSRGYRNFDGGREAWLWKRFMDQSDEECVEAAARIIEVYRHIGTYPETGKDFHHLAEFMGSLRWLSWGGEEELEGFLADHRPEIERRVREIHAQRLEEEGDE